MPTVIDPELTEGFEIRVYTRNEHRPPHVHVEKNGWEIRVTIGRRAEFWDIKAGRPKSKEIERAVALVQQHLFACRSMWRQYNGHL